MFIPFIISYTLIIYFIVKVLPININTKDERKGERK